MTLCVAEPDWSLHITELRVIIAAILQYMVIEGAITHDKVMTKIVKGWVDSNTITDETAELYALPLGVSTLHACAVDVVEKTKGGGTALRVKENPKVMTVSPPTGPRSISRWRAFCWTIYIHSTHDNSRLENPCT
jgi:hypothetical protein